MSFLILIIAAALLGTWALRPLKLPKDPEGASFRMLAGLILSAIVILALGSISLRWARFALYAIAAAGVIFELFLWRFRRKEAKPRALVPRPALTGLERLGMSAIAAALMLSLLGALAPVTSWDAAVAHLALPADYAREGRIMLIEGNAYSAYPHLMHCLFTGAYVEGGESAAALMSWLFGVLDCFMVYALGRRVGGRRCGIIAAAIFATAPIFLDQAGTVSLDVAFAALTAGALAAVFAWHDERKAGWVVLAGFFAGSSCGVRHTGYLVGLLLLIAVLLGKGPRRFTAVACYAGAAVLGAFPWMLRSTLLVGNPVYPFFMSLLSPNTVADAEISALGVHESLRGTGLRAYLMFPWNIIMRPHWYDGWTKSPGALLLILGPVGLIVGGRRAWWLAAFSLAGGTCLFFFRQHARYLLPFFVPMMVVAALAPCRLRGLQRSIAVILAIVFAYQLALDVAAVHFKIPAALRLEPRQQYLAERVERYPAFAWVNKYIPPSDTVLTLDPRSYYIEGRTFQNFEALKRMRGAPLDEQLAWLQSRGIAYLFYPESYVTESPGYAQSGLLDLLNTWRHDPRHFAMVKAFDLARARSAGTERVELYALQYPSASEDDEDRP